MKLLITSVFLLLSAASAQNKTEEPPVQFFTLSPAESPTDETPTKAPVTESPVDESPSAVPTTTLATDEPTDVTTTLPTVAPTFAPTSSPTAAPMTVSPAPTAAPSTAAPTTTSPTKLPTSKAPMSVAPVAGDLLESTLPSASNFPSDSPSDAPSKAPVTDIEVELSAQCVDNSGCAMLNLTGACCPTIDNWTLRCCGAPDVPHSKACANHTKCASEGLEDACCPTADGKWLDCCGTVPDECQGDDSCPLYSTVQYKLDLASASKTNDKTASSAVSMVVSASTLLVAVIAYVAL